MGGSRISAAAGRARTSLLGAFIVPINQARISSDRRSSDVQIVIRRWLSFINLFGSESASGSDSCTPQIPVRSAVNGAKHYAAGKRRPACFTVDNAVCRRAECVNYRSRRVSTDRALLIGLPLAITPDDLEYSAT